MTPSGTPTRMANVSANRQLDRGGQALDEDLGDAAALAERLAEVAREQVAEVGEELPEDRLVEPVALVEGVARRRRRPFPERRPARIAWYDPGETKTRATIPNSTGMAERARWVRKRISDDCLACERRSAAEARQLPAASVAGVAWSAGRA